jgi:NTP pyrophosphatase (non-canonical NTP hydrolase)
LWFYLKGCSKKEENMTDNQVLPNLLRSYTFQEYQDWAADIDVCPGSKNSIVYPVLGLVGEAGEVVEKVKKLWRNEDKVFTSEYSSEDKTAIAYELGDQLWYLSTIARRIGFTLAEIALMNTEKVQSRLVIIH